MGRLLSVAAAAGAVTLIAGCATVVQGNPVSIFADPFSVAGMPAVDGETGLRPDATGPARVVLGTDGGETDEFARTAVSDIEEFWESAFGETFDGEFTPVTNVLSWDSAGVNTEFCGEDTLGVENAGFCSDDNTIGWDRGVLLPSLREANGDMGVSMVLAHEYGHSVAEQSGIDSDGTPTLVSEQQADCLAGAYMRWVAEGKSPRFTLSTGDGLNSVLSAMISFRDPLSNEGDDDAGFNEHGSAFERVSAFQFGFGDGPPACAAIDKAEVEQRRGDLPVLLPADESGDMTIDEQSVRGFADAVEVIFDPTEPPELSFTPGECADSTSTDPAVYCPADNAVSVDLPALQELGTPSGEEGGLATGDYSAYSVVVSRYAMALQHERGVTLDTAQAALRTACLTGVATAKMAAPVTTPDGNSIVITAGDLDEAVSGLLVNGYAASDVNGATVPSGFARIDAFRIGVLGDEDRCFKRFA
jgi:predicted metalloprotease